MSFSEWNVFFVFTQTPDNLMHTIDEDQRRLEEINHALREYGLKNAII